MSLLSDNDDADDDEDSDADAEEASSIPPQTEEVDRFAYYTTVAVPLSDVVVPAVRLPISSSASSLQDNRNTEEHNNNGGVRMQLRCMESLTPVDMLHLANGTQDATGNRLWMGALFFIEAMIRPVPTVGGGGGEAGQLRERSPGCSSEDTEPQQLQQQLQEQDQLYHLRRELFHNRKVLELGCGTGAALLSLGIMAHQDQQQQQQQYWSPPIPTHITLTDKDPHVLALCRSNCQLNHLFRSTENRRTKTVQTSNDDSNDNDNNVEESEDPAPDPTPYCTARPLDWGCTLAGSTTQLRDCGLHDTVIATDVIYDLATLRPLFATASYLLQTETKEKTDFTHNNDDNKTRDRTTEDRSRLPEEEATERRQRYFVLAHVPRANIACEPQQIQHELEQRILAAAQHYNFRPIYPAASTGTPSNSSSRSSSSSRSPRDHCSHGTVTETGRRNTNTPDFDRLFQADQHNEVDYALRPNRVRAIFTHHPPATDKNENANDHDHDRTHPSRDHRNNRLLASTEYTYEDLQDCGASLMIFVRVD